MNKVAIIDLDGVIANSKTRFEMATQDGKIDWKVAFNPSLLVHDIPIDGAKAAVSTLVGQGYEIVYLTSRPEHMQAMTQAWLNHHDFSKGKLICKPESQKYTKTVKWKALQVAEMAAGYDRALFVDDEENNRFAVMQLALGNVDCFASLAEALQSL